MYYLGLINDFMKKMTLIIFVPFLKYLKKNFASEKNLHAFFAFLKKKTFLRKKHF